MATPTDPLFRPLTPAEFARMGSRPRPIVIHLTAGARRELTRLVKTGLHGRTIDDVAERLLCERLRELQR